jgi:hypothetical protein
MAQGCSKTSPPEDGSMRKEADKLQREAMKRACLLEPRILIASIPSRKREPSMKLGAEQCGSDEAQTWIDLAMTITCQHGSLNQPIAVIKLILWFSTISFLKYGTSLG